MNPIKPKLHQQITNKNPLESMRDLASGIGSSVINDVLKDSGSDFISQLLGLDSSENKSTYGDLTAGQEIHIATSSKHQERKPHSDIAPGLDYRREILSGEYRAGREDSRRIEVKIQEVIIELKRLTASSQVLTQEFKEVTIEQRITSPGEYHLAFFEWVLSLIITARTRVEDAGAWLAMFKSKKEKKKYWSVFKKQGTSFSLNNERTIATQSG